MRLPLALGALMIVTPAMAAGDFPLDCHGWEATITSLSGLNTANARMTGDIESGDVQEYCDRINDNDKEKIAQCLIETSRTTAEERPVAIANCPRHHIRFQDGSVVMQTLVPAKDESCAGFLTIEEMFSRLCPVEARKLHLQQ